MTLATDGLQNTKVYKYTYADATARTGASGFVSTDVGAIALQLDNGSLWMLASVAPTWTALTSAGALSDPTTTKGDLLVRSASAVSRLPVGADTYHLEADAAQTLGVKWSKPALTKLAEVVRATDGGITFASIPAGYRGLRLIGGPVRGTAAASNSQLYIQFNGDTGNNYTWTLNLVTGGGTNAPQSSGNSAKVARIVPGYVSADSAPAGAASSFVIDIPGYDSASFWKALTALAQIWNATGASLDFDTIVGGGNWQSTAAITDIKVFTSSGDNFKTGTAVALYAYS
jgi:hypothetical protein